LRHVVTDRDSNPPSSEREQEGDKKKERVIHTRVPAVLEQELKRLAENIRVPVSNLVRAILEDAVAVADRAGRGVEDGLHKAATNLSSQREAILAKKDRIVTQKTLEQVIGFQKLTLAGEALCAKCLTALHPGDDANLGISSDANAPRVVVCDACVPKKRS
jgi:RNase P subunit RPR2